MDNTPATLVDSSATQISATVHYSLAAPKTSPEIGSSIPVSLDVAPSALGIFAAIANGDGTLTLFAAGCASLTPDALPICQLAVTAAVNGSIAQVLNAGAAPGLVQGVNQVSLMIPTGISGPITVVLTTGAASSKAFADTLP